MTIHIERGGVRKSRLRLDRFGPGTLVERDDKPEDLYLVLRNKKACKLDGDLNGNEICGSWPISGISKSEDAIWFESDKTVIIDND